MVAKGIADFAVTISSRRQKPDNFDSELQSKGENTLKAILVVAAHRVHDPWIAQHYSTEPTSRHAPRKCEVFSYCQIRRETAQALKCTAPHKNPESGQRGPAC